MKTLLQALLTTAVLTVVCCGLYPLFIFAAARVCFPAQARGSLVYAADGTVRGSRLLAQEFTSDRYFHPRPSAAGTGYDAANSGGTNYGPTSAKLAHDIAGFVSDYRRTEGLTPAQPVPADAVTRSGSGLDPAISLANAQLQAGRIARARSLSPQQVASVIAQAVAPRDLGVLGEPGVNVLVANVALDQLTSSAHP